MTGMAKTDEELVAQALNGDPKGFETLIGRYQSLVFRIVYHYLGRRNEVEDIAQEVFLKVFRSLAQYDTGRPFKAWVSRIAVNSCFDELRKTRARKEQLFSELADEEQGRLESCYGKFRRGEGLNETEAEQLWLLLQRQLDELSEKDKMVFVLRELEGLDYAEIAASLETTELAIRVRLSRARKLLIDALCEKGWGGGVIR